MKIITDKTEILGLIEDFSQTTIGDEEGGEITEYGYLNQGEETEAFARVIYELPSDGNYDDVTGEFLGDWNDYIVRIEIDTE